MDVLADSLASFVAFQGPDGVRLPRVWEHLRATLLQGRSDVPEAAKQAAWHHIVLCPDAYQLFLDNAKPPITEAQQVFVDGAASSLLSSCHGQPPDACAYSAAAEWRQLVLGDVVGLSCLALYIRFEN
jgi:hypothetical protein